MISMDKLQFPNPIKIRKNTVLLNGEWQFGYEESVPLSIRVPFCPESRLSGIGNTDFIPVCYYRRTFVPERRGGRAFLHFGAVDYFSEVFVNGEYVGFHIGGYTPFSFDVTPFLREGENELFLRVRDEKLSDQARGKQSYKRKSFGCYYTRTTGIWQSVWLEYAPENRIEEVYFTPDTDKCRVGADLRVNGKGKYKIEVFYENKKVGGAAGAIAFHKKINIALSEKHLWEAGEGRLYDVRVAYEEDELFSYFGLRKAEYRGMDFLLNGKKVFQKLVLDQGYYPDVIYTAPEIADMQKDIDISLALGFNGARLHQKVFDPRFLYLCDKAGYLVWGEFASWGIDYSRMNGAGQFLAEWEEAMRRDFNHPCIITWCPLNEVWITWDDPEKQPDARLYAKGEKRENVCDDVPAQPDIRFAEAVYAFTKRFDKTRPCVDASGGYHGHKTDVFDFHCYEAADILKKYLAELENEDKLEVPLLYGARPIRYRRGQPVNISEYGGIALGVKKETATVNEGAVLDEGSWGYGKGADDGDAFVARYKELTEMIFACKKISGFCYTQLYDVEQEQNGFYDYHRNDKLSPAQKAAIKAVNDSYRG